MTPALVDHHVHIFGPASHSRLSQQVGRSFPPFTISELISDMDRDGVSKAAVLSTAYFFGGPDSPAEEKHQMRAENDNVADAVAANPGRLVGFFSVNPLGPMSSAEIERCAASGAFVGLKLHLTNSAVDLRDPTHVTRVADAFHLAGSSGLAVVVHMRTRRTDYGKEDAEAFVEQIIDCDPNVIVQVAHTAGWGGYDDATDAALAVLADHVASGGSRVWFDVSAVVRCSITKAGDVNGACRTYGRLVQRLRATGLDRVLFGTDWPDWTARAYAKDLERSLPLDHHELDTLLENRAPWFE